MEDVSKVESNMSVRELGNLLFDKKWQQNYINTNVQKDELKDFDRQTESSAKRSAGNILRASAQNGGVKPRFEDLYKSELPKVQESRKEERDNIQRMVDSQEITHKSILQSIQNEFENRKNDLDLSEALNSWGKSPNHDGDRKDGGGYNAGVIHYFEYRAYKDKRGHNKDNMSLDGFIERTRYLSNLVNKQNLVGVKKTETLEDKSGKRVKYLLTDGGLMVIAYSEAGQPFKMVTAILGQNVNTVTERIKTEINTPPDIKKGKRINYLGESIRRI